MSLRSQWSGSTLLRVASVLGVIALLAVAVVLAAAVFTESSTGKGAAINVAGSLRMQSYLLTVRLFEDDRVAAAPAGREAVELEIAAFERRLADPRLTAAIPADGPLQARYQRVSSEWTGIRSMARAAVEDPEALAAFRKRIHGFVADVDRLVAQLEADLESRIHVLQVALGATLFVILVLVLTAVFVLDVQVFQPVKELAQFASRVRAGDFKVRVPRAGPDEIGQLGQGFNHMVAELGTLYGSLEAQIAAKTVDLARSNQSLTLLYETARELSAPQLEPAMFERVAERLCDVLGVQSAVICARPDPTAAGLPLASAGDDPVDLCAQSGCERCVALRAGESIRLDAGHPQPMRAAADSLHSTHDRIVIPLLDGERQVGVMPLRLAAGQRLAPWQVELAQTVGRHLGAALAAAQARDEHRRLALFEERSAIARELHDSLAQSLSYTKIQLARLSALLSADGPRASGAALDVVAELREGVSSAYRQLRELLTTFRLQLSGKGLSSALAETVADFRARTGIDVQLSDALLGIELTANQQIHVLHVVREALANVEQHAQARHAWVRLLRVDPPAGSVGAQIEVSVEDDGVGIESLDSPRQHFGLTIMRDRAQLVDGSLDIGRRAQGGTAVRLRFHAGPPFSGATGTSPAAADLHAALAQAAEERMP